MSAANTHVVSTATGIGRILKALYMSKVVRGTIDCIGDNNQGEVSTMTPLARYHNDLLNKDFFEDPSQKQAVMLLEDLYHRLIAREKVLTRAQHPCFLSSFFNLHFLFKKQQQSILPAILPERGLYFFGGVGRGKTYLVDMFFESLPFDKKLRMHFHRFMQRIHHELALLEGNPDPLNIVADKLASEANILCFDEFFVSDITDAMILGTLLAGLFKRGVCLVATSNIAPDELYPNGLQRARFLPAIALINQYCEVVSIDSGIDYRLRALEQAQLYHFPLDEAAEANLKRYFYSLATPPYFERYEININNRKLITIREAEGVVHFDFSMLCDSPRSQYDYIEIACLYHTVLLSNVPQMNESKEEAARRFIAMVDEFYERNVKLIISADAPLLSLYVPGRLSFEFTRCCSRLKEMQSSAYLASAHLP